MVNICCPGFMQSSLTPLAAPTEPPFPTNIGFFDALEQSQEKGIYLNQINGRWLVQYTEPDDLKTGQIIEAGIEMMNLLVFKNAEPALYDCDTALKFHRWFFSYLEANTKPTNDEEKRQREERLKPYSKASLCATLYLRNHTYSNYLIKFLHEACETGDLSSIQSFLDLEIASSILLDKKFKTLINALFSNYEQLEEKLKILVALIRAGIKPQASNFKFLEDESRVASTIYDDFHKKVLTIFAYAGGEVPVPICPFSYAKKLTTFYRALRAKRDAAFTESLHLTALKELEKLTLANSVSELNLVANYFVDVKDYESSPLALDIFNKGISNLII